MWPRIASSRKTTAARIDGIYVSALMEGGEIIETAGERVLGRVALEDVKDPFTGEMLVKANEEIDEAIAEKIDKAGIERVKIRSVLSCRSKTRDLCQVLRARPCPRPSRQYRRSGRDHCRPVNRRAGNAAHDENIPYRRYGKI